MTEIVINTELNDDWMKALPGYQDEVELSEDLFPEKVTIPINIAEKGGAGSGNWGHAGRPGMVGGSAGRSGVGAAMSIRTGRTATQRQEEARRGKPSGSSFSDSAPGDEAAKKLLSTASLAIRDDVDYEPGINLSFVVDVEGDGKAIIKPGYHEDETYGETNAYEVAKALGWDDLVPPTVERPISDLSAANRDTVNNAGDPFPDGATMTVQLWADNAETAENFGGDWSKVDARAMGRMALLDGVIANNDRHFGNFLIKDGTQPVAIDHTMSMDRRSYPSQEYTNSLVNGMLEVHKLDITPHPDDVAALSSLRTNADLRGVVDAIYPAGRYDTLLARADVLQTEYGRKEVTIPIKISPKPGQST